jgi:hypothetical protein
LWDDYKNILPMKANGFRHRPLDVSSNQLFKKVFDLRHLMRYKTEDGVARVETSPEDGGDGDVLHDKQEIAPADAAKDETRILYSGEEKLHRHYWMMTLKQNSVYSIDGDEASGRGLSVSQLSELNPRRENVKLFMSTAFHCLSAVVRFFDEAVLDDSRDDGDSGDMDIFACGEAVTIDLFKYLPGLRRDTVFIWEISDSRYDHCLTLVDKKHTVCDLTLESLNFPVLRLVDALDRERFHGQSYVTHHAS